MSKRLSLTWNTDPLLFDSIPLPKNSWETANSLITQGKVAKIFQYKFPKISLYPIMIRKNDFISNERLLQSLPYIVLSPFWKETLRKQSLRLAERCRLYFDNSTADYSIRSWQKKIIDYTENQQRLPFPIFRLIDNFEMYFTSSNFLHFQSARGETFYMPLLLTADLAYFSGMVIGDGHLNYHNVELVDFSKEHMLMLQKLAKNLFGIQGKISGEKKIWLLHLNNKWVVRLMNFLMDQPISGPKYDSLKEPLIFKFDTLLRRHFWSGALDADGCYKRQVSFCSKSESFVQVFGSFLTEYQVPFKVRKIINYADNGYNLITNVSAKRIVGQLLLPRHVIKILDFNKYVNSKIYQPRRKHTDELALQIEEKQELRFQSFNTKNIFIDDSQKFFNFSLLLDLGVLHCQAFLKSLRKFLSWTQKQLATYLEIPEKVLTSYEHGSDISIKLLEKLLPLSPEDQPKTLMLFLSQNDLVFFRSRKTVARLPLQPGENFLKILQQLELRRGYLLINPKNGQKERVGIELSNFFSIPKPTGYKLSNSVIYLFAKTFCVY